MIRIKEFINIYFISWDYDSYVGKSEHDTDKRTATFFILVNF